MQPKRLISWILRIVIAGILLQTLYFKFTAAPESVYIFETLGMEPWGRVGTGVAELISAALILIPATVALGALLSLGLMGGAILGHLTQLGIVVMNDGGELFILAVVVFVLSATLLWLHRMSIPVIGQRFS